MTASRRQILCRGVLSTGALAGGIVLSSSFASADPASSPHPAARALASHTSNRLEIIDVLSRYSYAVDHRDWDAFDKIFAPDATVDLTYSQEGQTFRIAEFRRRLISDISVGTQSQHLLRNTMVLLKGRIAQAVSELIATAHMPPGDGKTYQLSQLRAVVFDDLTLTPSGWRIARRTVYAKAWELLPPNNRDWQPLLEATRLEAPFLTRATARPPGSNMMAAKPAMTFVEAQDRIEIEQVIRGCAQALDHGWDELYHSSFTGDAVICVRNRTSEMSSADYAKSVLRSDDADVLSSQHLFFNTSMVVLGDTATVVSNFFHFVLRKSGAGRERMERHIESGIVYDNFVRLASGWRIARRTIIDRFKALDAIDGGKEMTKTVAAARAALKARPVVTSLEPHGDPQWSPESLSDEEQIDRVDMARAMTAYARGIDEQWWELHRNAFTDDGIFNQPAGLGVLTVDEFRKSEEPDRKRAFCSTHGIGNFVYEIMGDRAHVLSEGNQLSLKLSERGDYILDGLFGHYTDEFVRTERGWRIKNRSAGLRMASLQPLGITNEGRDDMYLSNKRASEELVHL